MLSTAARSDGVGVGHGAIAALKFGEGLLTLLAVNIQNEDAALRTCQNANVRPWPPAPPLADHSGITASIFQAVNGARMLAGILAICPSA
jgi:hypothetical protein